MTLQEQLREKQIHLYTRYYGPNDLTTGWDIRGIVDNRDVFGNLYKKYPLVSLETLDDYLLYLYSRKFSCMSEIVPLLLQDDHKTIMSQLIDEATKACDGISNGMLVKFINSHIEEVFDAEDSTSDIRLTTLDLIASFSNGISKDVYAFLCRKYGYLLLDRFDSFERVFEKYPCLFSGMFPTGSLNEMEEFRFETILGIFAHIWNKDHTNLKATVERILPILCSNAEKLADEKEYRCVMTNERTFAQMYAFLNTIKHPRANDFLILHKKVEKQLEEGLEENGQLFSYEIPVGKIIKQYRSKTNWEVRLLSITHSAEFQGKKVSFASRLSKDEKVKSKLIDLVSTNVPTDDYYTLSRQQMLSIISSVGEGTLLGIVKDNELFGDYLSLLFSAITFISDTLKFEEEKLQEDAQILGNMLNLVVSNTEKGEEILVPFCYSSCMFLCALSEKLLRVTYITLVGENKYIPIDYIALGQLLNKDNSELKSVFGEIHLKNLAFFFLQVGEKRVGYNYRNSLAHWKNIDKKAVCLQLVLRLLFLFTDIVNTIFWYCYELELPEDNCEEIERI